MTNLPAERETTALHLPVPTRPDQPREDELNFNQVVAILRRSLWLILGCVAAATGVAVYFTNQATPVYQASVTVRITDKTPNLPGMFKPSGSELSTEAEVLRSRTLAEAAVQELALQLRLRAPVGVQRDSVVDSIQIEPTSPAGSYELRRDGEGHFEVFAMSEDSEERISSVVPGERLRLPGAAFRLRPAAAEHDLLRLSVGPMVDVANGLIGGVAVSQPGRDVKMLVLTYEDTDRNLVWRVPNTLVGRFIAQRMENQKEEARTTVAFLRGQLDTLARQLIGAENAVRRYREQHLVVSPEAEASSQVTRLIDMQAERSTLEGEKTALAQLLTQVDAQAAGKGPDDPSPYRQLLAFPTLLRSQAATDLLTSMSNAEQERTTLLARRTPQDPDVRALNARVKELEGQLRSVVAAYLQGLSNQITTIDAGLSRFSQQLGRLPERQLEVTRLERQPKVLEEIYTLLQTRLKEAEIAEAAQDPSVRLIDPAIPPRWPVRPRRFLNVLVGAIGGLMLGLALTVARELRDRAVRTRADVQVATGLPVLGLIPRIPVRGRRLALIAEKRSVRKAEALEPPEPPPPYVAPASLRRSYTFLAGVGSEMEESPAPAAAPPQASVGRPPNVLELAISEVGLPSAEAYSILETNITFARAEGEVKVIVLTSPLPGEGKTTTAVNLALSLARRGLSVLLIDADLRRGQVHTAFEAKRDPGLSDVLRGRTSFAQARGWVEVDGKTMHYLCAGGMAPNPTGTISSTEMAGLLAQLRAEYDLVIVDSPPTNIVTDASLLAAMCDGVIMVARSGVTEGGALSVAMDQLRHVRAPVLGVILNDIDFKRDIAYDSAYRYYNYSQYMDPARS